MRFDIQQIWTLFWWKWQQRRSYLQWSQLASWLQPTVWLPERICWISFSFCQTGQSLADEVWGPLQLEHNLGSSHWPSSLSFPQPRHYAATLQRWLVWARNPSGHQRVTVYPVGGFHLMTPWQKPWPIVTGVVGAFVIWVCVRILVVVL